MRDWGREWIVPQLYAMWLNLLSAAGARAVYEIACGVCAAELHLMAYRHPIGGQWRAIMPNKGAAIGEGAIDLPDALTCERCGAVNRIDP